GWHCATSIPLVPFHRIGWRATCPRSSADESGRLLNGGSGVRFTPRAPRNSTKDGWLAEREGNAVLTRRDLWVGQVRLLPHPPRRRSSSGRAAAFQAEDASATLAARSTNATFV